MATTLKSLNACPVDEFIALAGPVFEHSPWIAALAAPKRPFVSREALHAALCDIVRRAGREQQLELISAHPDLVGQTVLTAESNREQAAAGLMQLSEGEIAEFQRYNRAYRLRFGFPFIICARRNDKATILAAFAERIFHTPEEEIAAALHEIYQIAAIRLWDLLPESP